MPWRTLGRWVMLARCVELTDARGVRSDTAHVLSVRPRSERTEDQARPAGEAKRQVREQMRVARGGVEPPTFRFSGRPKPQVTASITAGVPSLCPIT